MGNKRVEFPFTQAEAMALFIIQLVCNNMAYEVKGLCDGWAVTVTGL